MKLFVGKDHICSDVESPQDGPLIDVSQKEIKPMTVKESADEFLTMLEDRIKLDTEGNK